MIDQIYDWVFTLKGLSMDFIIRDDELGIKLRMKICDEMTFAY